MCSKKSPRIVVLCYLHTSKQASYLFKVVESVIYKTNIYKYLLTVLNVLIKRIRKFVKQTLCFLFIFTTQHNTYTHWFLVHICIYIYIHNMDLNTQVTYIYCTSNIYIYLIFFLCATTLRK